ncbi:ComF family protein [Muricoccus radiodurans]|uniref:ComF family protein n=1 Tax=Muricoccus radiodurans TaxID=2231721 RepID=UPI003CEFFC48
MPFAAARPWLARLAGRAPDLRRAVELAQAAGGLAQAAAGGVLDALLPPTCLACDASVLEQGTVCAACFRGMHLLGAPMCDRCGVPFEHAGQGERQGGALLCPGCVAAPPAFDAARAAFAYSDVIGRVILPMKHADRPDLARHLARHMASAGAGLLARAELIVPVPLHRWRLWTRQYNQAALLARHLGRAAGRPVLPDALRRVRATRPLGGLSAAGRAVAVEGAFVIARRAIHRVAGRRVLLVDDVLTSGATAGACARVLLRAGASAVDVLAAARVPDPRLQPLAAGRARSEG